MLATGGKKLQDQKVCSSLPWQNSKEGPPKEVFQGPAYLLLVKHQGQGWSNFVFSHIHSPSVATAPELALEWNRELAVRP